MTETVSNLSEVKAWQNNKLADLIHHIVAKHHTFLREELPALEALLCHIVESGRDQSLNGSAGLVKTFRQFRRGLEQHMKKEEAILFPMIENLESAIDNGQKRPQFAFGSIAHPIAVMEQEHEQARKELAEMRALTTDYTRVPVQFGEHPSTLERLRALDADMEIHSRLEDEVLFPRAIGLERV